MEGIRSYFNKSGYSFKKQEQVKIITGQEEGIFAWIASNHLGNKFQYVKNALEYRVRMYVAGFVSAQILKFRYAIRYPIFFCVKIR